MCPLLQQISLISWYGPSAQSPSISLYPQPEFKPQMRAILTRFDGLR
jgi:hypothetical protein